MNIDLKNIDRIILKNKDFIDLKYSKSIKIEKYIDKVLIGGKKVKKKVDYIKIEFIREGVSCFNSVALNLIKKVIYKYP